MLLAFVLTIEFSFLALFHPVLSGTVRTLVDVLLIAVFSLALIAYLGRSERLEAARLPLLAGYLWRLALMLLDLYGKSIYHLPGSGGDSEGYYHTAVRFVSTGKAYYGGPFSSTMGTVFKWTGVSRLYGQFIIVLSAMVTLFVLYRILEELDLKESVRVKTVGVIALLPNYAILSSIFLRESFITMFCTLSLLLFVKWLHGSSNLYFIGAFASVFAASAFHSGVVGIAVGYIAVILLYNRERRNFRTKWTNIIPAVLLIIVVVFLYINYGEELFGKMVGIESIEDISSNTERGGSSYARYVGSSATPLNMVIYTLPRIIYYLFSPFPWQWRGLSDIIAFVFSSCFYFLVVWRVIGYLRWNKKNENRYAVLALSIAALCVVFIFAWGVTNTGTAIRHRDKVIALFAALYALTYREDRGVRITWGKKELL